MARRSSKELEIENAHLKGRIDELEKRTAAAEDYAEHVLHEAMGCSSCDSDDVWPGDARYIDVDTVSVPEKGQSVVYDMPLPLKPKGEN